MTTRSGANYNPMGDPTSIPSSSNPVNPPSDMARLESLFQSFATDMKAQVAEIKENLNETRSMTNRRLNELEHPQLSHLRDRRSSPHEGRPSPAQGHRSTPPLVYSPPYQPEQWTPHYEHRYLPPGYRPYSPSQGLIFQHIGLTHMSLGHTIRSFHIHMLGSDLYIQPLREIMDIEALIPMTASLKASRLKRQTLMVN